MLALIESLLKAAKEQTTKKPRPFIKEDYAEADDNYTWTACPCTKDGQDGRNRRDRQADLREFCDSFKRMGSKETIRTQAQLSVPKMLAVQPNS